MLFLRSVEHALLVALKSGIWPDTWKDEQRYCGARRVARAPFDKEDTFSWL
jgi:hypothetical protein